MNEPARLASRSSGPSSSSASPIRGIGELVVMKRWLPSSVSIPAVISLGNQPGHSAFHPHALASPLERQLLGQRDHGALAGHVVGLLDRGRADEAEHRRDVDDAAGSLRHHRDADLLAQVPDGRDVDLHGLAEGVDVLVLHGHGVAHAGVVDEDVHGPAALDDLGHQPPALVGPAEVRGDGDGAG